MTAPGDLAPGDIVQDLGEKEGSRSGVFLLLDPSEDGRYIDVDNLAVCASQRGDAPWTTDNFRRLGSLASVVSRRDADLRTRIEKVVARGLDDDGRNAARDALAEVRAALDGDTRETFVPAPDENGPMGEQGWVTHRREGVGSGSWRHTSSEWCPGCDENTMRDVARSRRPADTPEATT